MPRITAKISGGCAGKNCPAIWQTDDPGVIAVQGTLASAESTQAAGEIPDSETIVLIPASLLDGTASGQW
jgi:hypothetical protein